MNIRTFKKKWSVLRPGLHGRVKEKVDLELQELGRTAQDVANLSEEGTKWLYEHMINFLMVHVKLTKEHRKRNASKATHAVYMVENSGPEGAEKFVRPYELAYLKEFRAEMVEKSEVGITNRLTASREQLDPMVRKWIYSLPAADQPTTLDGMHEAVRMWAELAREGQGRNSSGNS